MRRRTGSACPTSSKHITRRTSAGTTCAFTQEELATRLSLIAQKLYTEDDSPYLTEDAAGRPVALDCARVGFTTAAVVELCREIGCPIHVVWANSKIESYVPLRPKYNRICYIVYGDHAYLVDDPAHRPHEAQRAYSAIRDRGGQACDGFLTWS